MSAQKNTRIECLWKDRQGAALLARLGSRYPRAETRGQGGDLPGERCTLTLDLLFYWVRLFSSFRELEQENSTFAQNCGYMRCVRGWSESVHPKALYNSKALCS